MTRISVKGGEEEEKKEKIEEKNKEMSVKERQQAQMARFFRDHST